MGSDSDEESGSGSGGETREDRRDVEEHEEEHEEVSKDEKQSGSGSGESEDSDHEASRRDIFGDDDSESDLENTNQRAEGEEEERSVPAEGSDDESHGNGTSQGQHRRIQVSDDEEEDDNGDAPRGDTAHGEEEEISLQDSARSKFYRLVADQREIPRLSTTPMSERALMRLPNQLAFKSFPFDPSTFDELDETGSKDRYRQNRTTVRWRFKKGWSAAKLANESLDTIRDPLTFAESNARVVKWSDGSKTLMVGSEHFEIVEQNTLEGLTYLFRRHPQTQVSEGLVEKKWQLRPASTQSVAGLRRPMPTKRHGNSRMLVVEDTTNAPELEEKMAEESRLQLQRAHLRRQREKQRREEKLLRENIERDGYGMTSKFLERSRAGGDTEDDEDDYEEEPRDEQKRKSRYESDSEEDDAGERLMSIKGSGEQERKRKKLSRVIDSDEDE